MHTLKKITLITGGQRSGKSGYAQRLALSQSPNPVYIATSRVWDEEHRQRIIRHQEDRGKEWDNIEEEKYLSKVNMEGRVAVIDCVTLWATNFFFDNDSDTEQSLEEIKKRVHQIYTTGCILYLCHKRSRLRRDFRKQSPKQIQ